MQPSRKRSSAVELRQPAPGPDEDLLRQVVRIRVIQCHLIHHAPHRRQMPPHQLFRNATGPIPLDGQDQFRIRSFRDVHGALSTN